LDFVDLVELGVVVDYYCYQHCFHYLSRRRMGMVGRNHCCDVVDLLVNQTKYLFATCSYHHHLNEVFDDDEVAMAYHLLRCCLLETQVHCTLPKKIHCRYVTVAEVAPVVEDDDDDDDCVVAPRGNRGECAFVVLPTALSPGVRKIFEAAFVVDCCFQS